ncbi:MAG: tryptophan 7-halogenase [Planctomycetales bacterium]|nr:tryptophan 7-halogenase [Planctomycetales bacterium]
MPEKLQTGSPQSLQSADVVVIGSGFGGSILAWILARAGRSVVLIDRATHPRFALGESSTPLADFLLEQIADQYNLPEIKALSRWGTWQANYPHLKAGKKRGFSYFHHLPGRAFADDSKHTNSLLVAASNCDELSDTHWLRSDVDDWLCQRAQDSGVQFLSRSRIERIARKDEHWQLHILPAEGSNATGGRLLRCNFVVDASGQAGVLPDQLGISKVDHYLRTRTGAMFGHFTGVESASAWLEDRGCPFDADDAAQHHILANGAWVWMLRFHHGVTSVGVVRPTSNARFDNVDTRWQEILHTYPSLAELMRNAKLIAPIRSGNPRLGSICRISRLWARAAGAGWALLPSTAGVVDPLHSTGIAHTLTGVLRLASLLDDRCDATGLLHRLQEYSSEIIEEVRWIDLIVASCYAAAEQSFELFCDACSLYFLAAIACERQLSENGHMTAGFLMHQDGELRQVYQQVSDQLSKLNGTRLSPSQQVQLRKEWREKLSAWDTAGLTDPHHCQRIARSAADKETSAT